MPFMESVVLLFVPERLLLTLILSQMNPVYTLTFYFYCIVPVRA